MKKSTERILVVDDEQKIVEVIKSYLLNSGYDVFEANNGKLALKLFNSISPSLVILDLMLHDMSGEEICRIIRKQSRVPIIMLTAKVDEDSILKGLNIGADDYITKPFSPNQLVARVIAILRRISNDPVALSNILSFNNGDLLIDSLNYEVRKNGNIVNLTPNEFRILMTMVKYPKKIFSRDELISMALGEEFDGFDRTVDAHIKNLRQKIETLPKSPKYIYTVHRLGYRFGGE